MIYLNAFVVGVVLIGFEMLGSRYLFPYFGGGIGTWAGLISGYWSHLLLVMSQVAFWLTGSRLYQQHNLRDSVDRPRSEAEASIPKVVLAKHYDEVAEVNRAAAELWAALLVQVNSTLEFRMIEEQRCETDRRFDPEPFTIATGVAGIVSGLVGTLAAIKICAPVSLK